MQGFGNISILVPTNLSWNVSGTSKRAKSEVTWFRRNRASEPCPRPTKSRWKDRGTPRPRRKNFAGGGKHQFSIFSTSFCGPWAWLGRSVSPQPRHFGLCPPGFPSNFSRRFFCYSTKIWGKKNPRPLNLVQWSNRQLSQEKWEKNFCGWNEIQ